MSAKRKNKSVNNRRRLAKSLILPVFDRTIYLFTEGETEQQYIIDLAQDTNVEIVPFKPISSPRLLAETVKAWLADKKDWFASGNVNAEVWIIFDEDEKNGNIEEFCKAIKGVRNVRVAYMKPCIELWGVMCVQGNTSGLAKTHRKVESALKKVMPGYDHSGNPYFDTAKMVKTAQACQQAAQWDKSYPTFSSRMNAAFFAGIHTLVEELLGAPRRQRKMRV